MRLLWICPGSVASPGSRVIRPSPRTKATGVSSTRRTFHPFESTRTTRLCMSGGPFFLSHLLKGTWVPPWFMQHVEVWSQKQKKLFSCWMCANLYPPSAAVQQPTHSQILQGSVRQFPITFLCLSAKPCRKGTLHSARREGE